MIGYKVTETLGGGGIGLKFQMDSQRRETTLSNNGTNELIANLDHELLDVRVRALKCLLRKLECGIISSEGLKDRVDLLDRCRRWLSSASEGSADGNKNLSLDSAEVEGIELVVQLLYELSKHREFRDLMRLQNVDSLLYKLKPYLSGDFKCQLDALVNSLVVGQFELSYEGAASEWFDNKTCPALTARTKPLDMYSSRQKPYEYDYNYKPYGELSQDRRSPSQPSPKDSDTSRSTPETQQVKKSNLALSSEDGWMQNIPFFVPSVDLAVNDRRIINSTVDSLSATSEPLVLMTVCFIRDTLTMDYPPELFIQDSSLLLALAQVTVSRWSDHRIPYMAIQTLLKISSNLRFRFSQLNSSEQYEVPGAPTGFLDKKHNNLYYDYDGVSSYSSRMMQNPGTSSASPTDAVVENFVQLFKSFSRSLLYTSYDIHIWTVFDSFAFTMYKCIRTFPVDSKSLTLSLQGVLMELAHIWERKSDFHTVVGLCLVSASILNSMKVHNETFIVSKDVRNMLRSLSYSPVIRSGWPEVFEYFIQFSSMFDPSAGIMSDHQKDQDGDNSENHPKRKILNLLYAIQNASSHEEVAESVDLIRDVLLPITLNLRLGEDSLAYILQDAPWRDTFYRFLCIEPTTEGDETLLGRVLDLFSYILQNSLSAKAFKWITPLCCEKACTTLKLLASAAVKVEMRHGGTALSDLVRSLLEFYSAVFNHASTLLSSQTKWEIFQIYTSILNSLEEATYSNFALLTGVTKELATISEDKDIQSKLKANPILSLALIHRLTDAVMVLASNGVLFEGFKNTSAVYYLSICVVHMLFPMMKDEACKTFKGDWIDRCGRAFQIFSMSADPRTKCQAFQVCEIFTTSSYTRPIFVESSFREAIVSLLQTAYSTFVDPKQPSFIKVRAGNTILNVLKDEDEKSRLSLARRLQQEYSVLVDISRLCSRVLWTSKISDVTKKSTEKSTDISNVNNTEVPFITPRVLTVLCKILMSFIQSVVESGSREVALQEVTSSGICQILFRIIMRHPLNSETNIRLWLDYCCALSTVLETLISLTKLDRTISIILIGEKKCLSMMFSLLDVESPPAKGVYEEKTDEVTNALCGNIFNLATVLCCDAGNNFEDLERVAWTHQLVLFTKLTDWLKVSAPVVSRRAALGFSHGFLSILSHRTVPEQGANYKVPAHPFLCRKWKDNFTYGQALCENLINILKNAVDYGERMSAMKSLAALFSLSCSSVQYAVDENGFIEFCVQKLHGLGCKYYDTKNASINKKNTSPFLTETLSYVELLSCIFYVSSEAKRLALQSNFPDILHKIFGWWTCLPDFSLLHAYIEALLNFTEEFPEGALALTLTSNVIGVGPRRVPTQQSIFIEIIGILEKDLSNVEHNPNLKSVEIIFELLKNFCFVQECRNILLKSSVISFLKKLHNQETKKWGNKQNTVKANFLDFLVHASAHSDVQSCIAKIQEGLEILVQVMEADTPPASTLALKVLRNLCFQQANKGRLLSENMFMPSLSNKLSQSSDLNEIEHATISLWALVANYEKGRLFAKKAYCGESISKALTRVKKMEQTSNTDSEEITRVISLLETVQKLIGTSNPAKQAMNSRSSSLSQV